MRQNIKNKKLSENKGNINKWLKNYKHNIEINRLRIGHTKLTHRQLMANEEAPTRQPAEINLQNNIY